MRRLRSRWHRQLPGPRGSRPGFSLFEVALVLAVSAVVASFAVMQVSSSREKTYQTVMLKDLERYAGFQEAYHDETQAYATTPGAITAFALSADVVVRRSMGWASGYQLVLGHAKTATQCQLVMSQGASTTGRPMCSASGFAPTALIHATPNPASVGQTIALNGSTSLDGDGSVVTHQWVFSDGTVATGAATTKTFSSAGDYSVRLRVTDNAGRWAEATAPLVVTEAAVADFAMSPNPARPDEVVTMTALPGDDVEVQDVSWTFGDSESGAGFQTEHRYASAGAKLVTMTLIDANGASTTVSKTLTVTGTVGPTAAFTYTPVDPSPEEPVRFDGASSSDPDGQVMRWQWNFGDGAVAEGQSASHAFAAAGVYTVTLTVTDDNGLQASTVKTVTVAPRPIAYFSATPNPVIAGRVVTFDGSASVDPNGSIAQWTWAWGDGQPGVSLPTPTATHVYATAGQYMATLVVRGSSGRTAQRQGAITVIPNQPPVASSIVCTPTIPTMGASASCTAYGSDADGTIVQWDWAFPDDASTPQGNPVSHAFAGADVYTVMARATDDLGAVSNWASLVVDVNAPPACSFTTSTPYDSYRVGREITFTSTSTDSDDAITYASWNYGDGATENGTSVGHKTFATAGTKTVTLTVTDSRSGTTSCSQTVTVQANAAPTATFSWTPTYPLVNELATFSSSGSADADGAIVAYRWTWGYNGEVLTGGPEAASAQQDYPAAGTYTVTLTVTDDLGATGSSTKSVIVNQRPFADYSYSTPFNKLRVGRPVTFTDLSTDADGTLAWWSWIFGGAGSSNTQHPSFTFTAAGSYAVTLNVYDNYNATQSVTKTLVVSANEAPTAGFTVSPTFPTPGQTVTLTSTSSDADGAIGWYAWDNTASWSANGASMTVATFTAPAAGVYWVGHSVTDDLGAGGSTSQQLIVNGPPACFFGHSTPYNSYRVGRAITFTSSSSDGDDGIATTAWAFGDGTSASGTTVAKTYSSAGTWTVTLTVTDTRGASTSCSTTVTVSANQGPTANFTIAPAYPEPGQTVTVTSTSSDPDGAIGFYAWDNSAGWSASSPTLSTTTFTAPAAGTYWIGHTVWDDMNASAFLQQLLTVNGPPQCYFGHSTPYSIYRVGRSITFTSSSSDGDGGITSWQWAWGDGTNASGASASKTYSTSGVKTITHTVTDARGSSRSCSTTISVGANQAPNVPSFTWTPAPPAPGQNTTFTASASDPDGGIVSYTWSFSDGGTGSGSSFTRNFSPAGTYNATLTVQDDLGATNARTQAVSVVDPNRAPTISVSPTSASVPTGGTSDFVVTTSDPDGDAVTVAAAASCGTITNLGPWGSPNSWRFGAPGAATTCTLTFTANDGRGLTAQASVTVTVFLVIPPPSACISGATVADANTTVTLSDCSTAASGHTITGRTWGGTYSSVGGGGTSAQVTRNSAGTTTTSLSVTQSDGQTSSDSHAITWNACQRTSQWEYAAAFVTTQREYRADGVSYDDVEYTTRYYEDNCGLRWTETTSRIIGSYVITADSTVTEFWENEYQGNYVCTSYWPSAGSSSTWYNWDWYADFRYWHDNYGNSGRDRISGSEWYDAYHYTVENFETERCDTPPNWYVGDRNYY